MKVLKVGRPSRLMVLRVTRFRNIMFTVFFIHCYSTHKGNYPSRGQLIPAPQRTNLHTAPFPQPPTDTAPYSPPKCPAETPPRCTDSPDSHRQAAPAGNMYSSYPRRPSSRYNHRNSLRDWGQSCLCRARNSCRRCSSLRQRCLGTRLAIRGRRCIRRRLLPGW